MLYWASQHHDQFIASFFFLLLRYSLSINVGLVLFQAFREEIAPINLKVKTVNDLSSQLSPLDLYPSLKMSRQLDDLNMRWKLLQVFFRMCAIAVGCCGDAYHLFLFF